MSAKLAKAILVRLKKTEGKGPNGHATVAPDGDTSSFEVQFNPTSLKISRQNNVDKGGSTIRTQARQNPSTQSAILTFDLEYDTAEGDAAGQAVDVRTKTMQIRQFVEPSLDDPKEPPPPVRFIWGTFHFSGLVSSLTEDLDYFSPEGRPLRAKVSVTITEQDPRWEANFAGPGVRDAQAATRPGEAGAKTGLGAAPAPNPDRTAIAQGGESLQQLLTRIGADPATWRAAMEGLDSPLSLAAGAQIQLSAGLSAGAGIGMSAGFAAGVQLGATASLGAALGLGAGAGVGLGASAGAGISTGTGINAGGGFSAGAGFSADARATAGFSAGAAAGSTSGTGIAASEEMAAGFALAAGGGVSASLNTVLSARAAAEVTSARDAFDVPGAPARGSAGASATGSSGFSASSGPFPVDPRTQSYGISIPLRAPTGAITVTGAVMLAAAGGTASIVARARGGELTVGTTAGAAPWVQLPGSTPERSFADGQQRQRDAGPSTMRFRPGR